MGLIRERLPVLEDAMRKFASGEFGRAEYKGVSGGFGTYAQKDPEKHMVRLRLAGGRLTADALSLIVKAVEEHGSDLVHFTTCQTVQVHNLPAEGALALVRDALDAGIVTFGGGGDFPRNVTASPLSGIDPGEAFDVRPFALAAERYLLGVAPHANLPRKLKVAFSNGTDDVQAKTRDLGFVARPDGTFDVYAAGGLGNSGGRHGALVAEGLDPMYAVYCVEAMVDVFSEHGDRESRARARTRFMRDSMGEDGFVAAFKEALSEAQSRGGLGVDSKPSLGTGSGPEGGWPMTQRDGLYAMRHRPVGGGPAVADLPRYLAVLEGNPGSEIRLGTDRTVYFVNLPKGAADSVAATLGDAATTPFRGSVACVGGTVCQVGRADSRGMLLALLESGVEDGLAEGALPMIRISGCGSSCASHQLAPMGFRGATAKGPDGRVPGYEVHYRVGDSLAELAGTIPETAMAAFVREVGQAASPDRFEDWIKANEKTFLEIVGRHSTG
ncbi:MAG: nitrite/sulfite reductase [Thermoplasmatales archaeon]|nr:nitrite/sulfite reductase [Thermoplasmatales archaeon]